MNIYVGNLPLDITKDELQREFSAYGKVLTINLMSDKYISSGHVRVYGYVEMASTSEGERAIIGLKNKTIRENVIEIIGALPLTNDKNTGSNLIKKPGKYSKKGRQRTR